MGLQGRIDVSEELRRISLRLGCPGTASCRVFKDEGAGLKSHCSLRYGSADAGVRCQVWLI